MISSRIPEEATPTSCRTDSAVKLAVTRCNRLIEQWKARRAWSRRQPRPAAQARRRLHRIFSLPHKVSKLIDDLLELDRAKTEVLAARADGLRNIFGLRCRHHENDVPGRLLQRLQQRIEGGVGDLVGFVENVNLEAIACRTITRGFAQLADFINAAVGGRVDLDDVHGIARADLGAGIAYAARLGHRAGPTSGSSAPSPECGRRWFFRCRDVR